MPTKATADVSEAENRLNIDHTLISLFEIDAESRCRSLSQLNCKHGFFFYKTVSSSTVSEPLARSTWKGERRPGEGKHNPLTGKVLLSTQTI